MTVIYLVFAGWNSDSIAWDSHAGRRGIPQASRPLLLYHLVLLKSLPPVVGLTADAVRAPCALTRVRRPGLGGEGPHSGAGRAARRQGPLGSPWSQGEPDTPRWPAAPLRRALPSNLRSPQPWRRPRQQDGAGFGGSAGRTGGAGGRPGATVRAGGLRPAGGS